MVEKEKSSIGVDPALTREARVVIRAMQAVRPRVIQHVPEESVQKTEATEKVRAPDTQEGWERAALQARFGGMIAHHRNPSKSISDSDIPGEEIVLDEKVGLEDAKRRVHGIIGRAYEQHQPNITRPIITKILLELQQETQRLSAHLKTDDERARLEEYRKELSEKLEAIRSAFKEEDVEEQSDVATVSPKQGKYSDGVNFERQESYVTTESPSPKADEALRSIQRAWEKSYLAQEGEHVGYRVVKNGQEEIFWGDFVHNKMQNLSGREQEYVKDHLPQSHQMQSGQGLDKKHDFPKTESQVVMGGGKKEPEVTQDPDYLSGSPQERIAKLREKIEEIKRRDRIREVREKLEKRLQRS